MRDRNDQLSTPAPRLLQPSSGADWAGARNLVERYIASLNLDLSFQNVAHELEHLESEYGPPTGAFLIADDSGAALGCVGVRRIDDEIGEIKRLYLDPAARGRGVGRLLAEGIVTAGKNLGYARLRLDTLPDMHAARALYASLGFRPIAPYRFNPVEGTAYLELVFD